MKRFLSLFLALALVFAFAACSKDDTASSSSKKSASTASSTFVKPDNYASVLLVSINPQIRLYLDENGTVLAVEAVNKDAEAIKESLKFENQKYDAVIQDIVTAANEEGYIKEGVTVSFEVSEVKSDKVSVTEILDSVSQAADDTAAQLDIEIKVVTEDKSTSSASSEQSQGAASASSEQAQSTAPEHSHTFANATCTAPKTCSCGATEGKALGHSYDKGVCTRCNASDPNYKATPLSQKSGKWTFRYVVDGTLYNASLTLCGSSEDLEVGLGFGDSFATLPEDFQEDIRKEGGSGYIVFEGKEYYVGRGTGDGLKSVAENGNTVTVTDLEGNTLQLTRTGEDTMTVKGCAASFSELGKVPVGTVLTFKAN